MPRESGGSTDALAAEHRGDVPDGTYFIQSAVNQGYVLDVRWASGDNRANVQLYEKNDSNAQRWQLSHEKMGILRSPMQAAARCWM